MAILGHARCSRKLRRNSKGPHVIDCDARVPPPSTAAASIDRDARVPPPSTAAASTDQLTPPGTQRQIAQALPGNLGKLNRAKRDSERRKTPQAKAAFAVRTSSSAYKAAKKKWNSKSWATAKSKTATTGRRSSVAYKAAQTKI
jgi:hypothetical protein